MKRFIFFLFCTLSLAPLTASAILNGDVVRPDSPNLSPGVQLAAKSAVRLNMTWLLGTFDKWAAQQRKAGSSATYVKTEDMMTAQCSGSLINANVVLTSAHCFHPPQLPAGARLAGVTVQLFNQATYFAIVSSVQLAPGNEAGKFSEASNDLAMIKFDTSGSSTDPSMASAVPAVMLPGPSPSRVNVEVLGYGASSSANKPDYTAGALRVGSMVLNLQSEKTYASDSSSVSHVCHGDSGGPVFTMDESGNPRLIAMTRMFSGLKFWDECNQKNLFVNLDAYRAWIQDTAAKLLAANYK